MPIAKKNTLTGDVFLEPSAITQRRILTQLKSNVFSNDLSEVEEPSVSDDSGFFGVEGNQTKVKTDLADKFGTPG